MTASECLLWPVLMAPSPGADGRAEVTGVDQARRLDIGHDVRFVDVAKLLPQAPAFVRQYFVRLPSYPAPTAAH